MERRADPALEQTVTALKAQAEQQARMLEEKDRQILELHALLRDALRTRVPALPAPAGEREARPWWRRLLGG